MNASRLLTRGTLALACTALLGACAQNYTHKISSTTDALKTGAVDNAIAAHEAAYKDTAVADRDLLYFMERGELLRTGNKDIGESTQAWLTADERVRGWEDEARGKLQKGAGQLGAWLLSDGLARYDGQDYEKVWLSTRLAENHLAAGDWDKARVEVRRMYERETLIEDLRDKQVEAIKDAAKEKKADASAVKTADIKGYPVEIFNDPEVTNLRNAYQSAVSHYLAAFLFEASQDKSLAAAGYRKAIELRPDVTLLRDGLAQLDTKKPQPGKTDVLVLVETGFIPRRESLKITLPVPIGGKIKILSAAYPTLRPQPDDLVPTSVTVGTDTANTAMVTNLDAMARRALRDDMPTMIARSVTRMVVSAAAQEVLDRQNNTAASLMSLAVGIGSAVTADADTREWQSLPAHVSLARLSVPSGPQHVTLATPRGPITTDVNVTGRYAVLVLRPLGPTVSTLASVAPANEPVMVAEAAPVAPAPTKRKVAHAPARKSAAAATNSGVSAQ